MPLFRIHMADGRKINVTSSTPNYAAAKGDGPINKIKRVKETS